MLDNFNTFNSLYFGDGMKIPVAYSEDSRVKTLLNSKARTGEPLYRAITTDDSIIIERVGPGISPLDGVVSIWSKHKVNPIPAEYLQEIDLQPYKLNEIV
jgi:hypothetical protein